MPNHGKGPPKIQFCPRGHDTFVVGRTNAGLCRECKKENQANRGSPYLERRSWRDMHRRCNDLSDKNYGGRGVIVCERWSSFELFFEDMGKIPGPGYELDRKDPYGNYEPGNCQWIVKGTGKKRNKQETLKRALAGQPSSL